MEAKANQLVSQLTHLLDDLKFINKDLANFEGQYEEIEAINLEYEIEEDIIHGIPLSTTQQESNNESYLSLSSLASNISASKSTSLISTVSIPSTSVQSSSTTTKISAT
jgi:hypothetical protein